MVECPQCRSSNPFGTAVCLKCSTPLEVASPTLTDGGWSDPATGAPDSDIGQVTLPAGIVLAGRYEILQLLGRGGMGAVYKARDRELDRLVALKVIRPELAGHAEVLRRFKQELILARQITHKNVIRIFDLGQSDGIKFISMEYIEGRDLASRLAERGKMPPQEAARLIQQVCRGLDAAHAEGVIHRDLKPRNIMVDQQGKVTVMDFGIARSMEVSDLTRTGALLGTPAYMSPEQAKGEKADARSDLFTLGIIFYELLTGKLPYESETAMGTLLKRTQEPAVPPLAIDPTLPRTINDIVVKCLAVDPGRRYQSSREILQGLEAWLGPAAQISTGVVPPARRASSSWKWITVGLAVVLLAVAGLLLRDRIVSRPRVKQKPVTVLLADFQNATGDPVFDGTLEPMFTIAMEGASFVSAYNRVQARQLAGQLRAGAGALDENVARLVAVREGVNIVVAGSIRRQGEGYQLEAKAIDAVNGKTIVTKKIEADSKEKVLATVGKLAAPIRKALGDVTPESAQLAAAETFTASSVEAAHQYGLAQQWLYEGKMEDALRGYTKAIELDPNMGRAYSGAAAIYRNLGRRQDAEKYFKEALARIDRMTEREKYRTRGVYYMTVGNQEKAIEEYTALASRYPADNAGHSNLAVAYSGLRNMPKALEEARLAIEINPRSVVQRHNLAMIALYAGDIQTAEREARAALELNSSYAKAYVALALAKLARGKAADAADAYDRLAKVGTRGASYAASGLADLALYEGRWTEGVATLEKGAATDLANGDRSYAAAKLMHLAHVQLLKGQTGAALTSADRALDLSKDQNVLFTVGRVYVEAGQEAKARPITAQLAVRLELEPQSYARLIEGEALLKRGNAKEAVKVFQGAQKLLDTWIARFLLGRAHLEAGAFAQARSEFDLCLKRRGEGYVLFRDEIPTAWLVPPVYYYLGRAQEGGAAAESYRTFLSLREKGGEDPLIADTRRRLGR
jgi:tetratricopeptide (TPR) repeat protein/predicted Ser/Thr protein kinase